MTLHEIIEWCKVAEANVEFVGAPRELYRRQLAYALRIIYSLLGLSLPEESAPASPVFIESGDVKSPRITLVSIDTRSGHLVTDWAGNGLPKLPPHYVPIALINFETGEIIDMHIPLLQDETE